MTFYEIDKTTQEFRWWLLDYLRKELEMRNHVIDMEDEIRDIADCLCSNWQIGQHESMVHVYRYQIYNGLRSYCDHTSDWWASATRWFNKLGSTYQLELAKGLGIEEELITVILI